ncbi:hypothetical protein ACL02O_34095, partial [Micromonospora sp. MS34]|uniref:hypothetical protein n=1 Tax=Micromonospora sp. MS34 TaxID=3385971 RepID=UPI0039A33337
PKDVDWPKALEACSSREDLAVLWQRAQRLGLTQKLRGAFTERGAEIAAARNAAAVPSDQLDRALADAATAAPAVNGRQPETAGAGR